MIEFVKSAPLKSSLGASSLFMGYRKKSRASGTRKETFFRLLSQIASHATRNESFLAGLQTMDLVH